MVEKLAKDCEVDYVMPKTLEAVAAIISQFLKNNNVYLFSEGEGDIYTRSEEEMVVGGFAPSGLVLNSHYYVGDGGGVAGLRKFFIRS